MTNRVYAPLTLPTLLDSNDIVTQLWLPQLPLYIRNKLILDSESGSGSGHDHTNTNTKYTDSKNKCTSINHMNELRMLAAVCAKSPLAVEICGKIITKHFIHFFTPAGNEVSTTHLNNTEEAPTTTSSSINQHPLTSLTTLNTPLNTTEEVSTTPLSTTQELYDNIKSELLHQIREIYDTTRTSNNTTSILEVNDLHHILFRQEIDVNRNKYNKYNKNKNVKFISNGIYTNSLLSCSKDTYNIIPDTAVVILTPDLTKKDKPDKYEPYNQYLSFIYNHCIGPSDIVQKNEICRTIIINLLQSKILCNMYTTPPPLSPTSTSPPTTSNYNYYDDDNNSNKYTLTYAELYCAYSSTIDLPFDLGLFRSEYRLDSALTKKGWIQSMIVPNILTYTTDSIIATTTTTTITTTTTTSSATATNTNTYNSNTNNDSTITSADIDCHNSDPSTTSTTTTDNITGNRHILYDILSDYKSIPNINIKHMFLYPLAREGNGQQGLFDLVSG